ncbi:MAG: glycoside hydrolase family 2, partial [Anaerolineales bacterium]|nr:glycoside hydrolase family 2 [Anaerolineales bacterium]
MTRVSLTGEWQLAHGPENQAVLHPDHLAGAGFESLPAQVPGNVELDLERAGILPDPFYAANIRTLRPYETHEWWYTRTFTLPERPEVSQWDVVFEGLDTLATVWVNGVEVGRAENQLIEHRFDVTHALRRQPGQPNQIAVRLSSALNAARRFHYDASAVSGEQREEGLFIRKAPHVWGWDIMPRAVSAGIWRPVWLEERAPNAIEQLYYWTASVGEQGATLGVRFQVRTELEALDGLRLRFSGQCGDHCFTFEWPIEFIAGGCRIPVQDARLWWPKGYGQPNLYTVTATLLQGERVLAERTDRIGIRSLEVRRTERAGQARSARPAAEGMCRWDEPADPASHFVFVVNGEPIMVKGANWVPLDAFHSRDAERVERAVGLFDDLGCNMIRCWGGNVYEDHAFFDRCDECGIM